MVILMVLCFGCVCEYEDYLVVDGDWAAQETDEYGRVLTMCLLADREVES